VVYSGEVDNEQASEAAKVHRMRKDEANQAVPDLWQWVEELARVRLPGVLREV
jgi:hypothetical protein